jgi:hypothetical protein
MSPLIIWLNEQVPNSSSSLFSELDQVQIFTQPIKCVEYIQNHQYQPVFLLISGSIAKQLVPSVFDCSNLVKIFFFCASNISHVDWTIGCSNKVLMFDNEGDLLEGLWNEISSYFQEQAHQCLRQADEFKQRVEGLKQPSCG